MRIRKNKKLAFLLAVVLTFSGIAQSMPAMLFATDAVSESQEASSDVVDQPIVGETGDVSTSPASSSEPSTNEGEVTAPSDSEEGDGTSGESEGSSAPEGEVPGDVGAPGEGDETDPTLTPEALEEEEPQEEELRVVFVANNGSLPEFKPWKKGEALGELPVPKKEGFDFLGWFFEDGKPVDESLIVTETVILYADWELIASNPDHLSSFDESPYGGAIDYGIWPAVDFGLVLLMQ